MEKKADRTYRIPMEVTEETIRDFEINREDVVPIKIGSRSARGIMVPATKEEYEAYMRPLWREAKRKERHGSDFSADLAADMYELEIPAKTDIAREAEEKETRLALAAALEKLSASDRDILTLFAEGIKEKEIAERLSLTVRGVRYRKEAALRRLRAAFLSSSS